MSWVGATSTASWGRAMHFYASLPIRDSVLYLLGGSASSPISARRRLGGWSMGRGRRGLRGRRMTSRVITGGRRCSSSLNSSSSRRANSERLVSGRLRRWRQHWGLRPKSRCMTPVGSSHFTRVTLHAYMKPSKSAISRPIFEGTCYGLDRLPTLPRSSSIRQPTLYEALPLRREEVPDQPRRHHASGVSSG